MNSSVTIERVRGRSEVVALRCEAPLQLRTPRNRGDAAWVYQSNLGGGFVGADALSLNVDVRAGASAFLSAQASSKAYGGARSRFALDAHVGAGAVLSVWPEPVTCFSGAALSQRQHVQLADASSSVLIVDSFTAGRVARAEQWAFAKLESRLHVDVGGAPWLREAFTLDAAHGDLRERMASLEAFSTVVVKGPRFESLRATLTAARERDCLVTVSARDDGAVVRLAATKVAALLERLRLLLREPLAQVLGDFPLDPVFGRSSHGRVG